MKILLRIKQKLNPKTVLSNFITPCQKPKPGQTIFHFQFQWLNGRWIEWGETDCWMKNNLKILFDYFNCCTVSDTRWHKFCWPLLNVGIIHCSSSEPGDTISEIYFGEFLWENGLLQHSQRIIPTTTHLTPHISMNWIIVFSQNDELSEPYTSISRVSFNQSEKRSHSRGGGGGVHPRYYWWLLVG